MAFPGRMTVIWGLAVYMKGSSKLVSIHNLAFDVFLRATSLLAHRIDKKTIALAVSVPKKRTYQFKINYINVGCWYLKRIVLQDWIKSFICKGLRSIDTINGVNSDYQWLPIIRLIVCNKYHIILTSTFFNGSTESIPRYSGYQYGHNNCTSTSLEIGKRHSWKGLYLLHKISHLATLISILTHANCSLKYKTSHSPTCEKICARKIRNSEGHFNSLVY